MRETKVGIVEDEVIIADSIRAVLKSMNYTVPEPANDYIEAIDMLQQERPDLVLLDIMLEGSEQDGIAVGAHIRQHYDMPFIFLTANSDAATLVRAKAVFPNAYLVKPFVKEELHAAIEIAMHNFYAGKPPVQEQANAEYMFIKDGGVQHKILFSDILYLESDHVYVSVHTTARRYLVRTSLQDYAARLDDKIFIRIHRGYIVNKNKIDKISQGYVTVGNVELPVSKKHKSALTDHL